MLKDVVQVCTDGSDLSHKGIESAVEIAKALHLPVVGMTAVLSKPNTVHGLEHEDKAVQERLAAVKNLAEAAEIPYELVAEHCESVADGILNVADRHDKPWPGNVGQPDPGLRNPEGSRAGRPSRACDPLSVFWTEGGCRVSGT